MRGSTAKNRRENDASGAISAPGSRVKSDREVQAAERRLRAALARARRDGNRASAIRAFCLQCMGGSLTDVKDCPSTDCPLHPFRTGRQRQAASRRQGAEP